MTDPGWLIALAALAVLGWITWDHRRGRRLNEQKIERDIAELAQSINEARTQMAAPVQLFQDNLKQSHLALEHAEQIERETKRLLDIALDRVQDGRR